MDTLTLYGVHQMSQLEDLYKMPGANYQLDHFVLFISLPGIDPIAAYNRTYDLTANTIENLKRLTSVASSRSWSMPRIRINPIAALRSFR
jgi:hypothetical protein